MGGVAKSRSATNERSVVASSAAQGGRGAERMHYAWAGMLGKQRISRALRGVVPLRGLRRTHLISPAEAATAGEESSSVKWGASWAARQKQRELRDRG